VVRAYLPCLKADTVSTRLPTGPTGHRQCTVDIRFGDPLIRMRRLFSARTEVSF
jgi:hypothetical protein